jgi:hypothetical protein
MKVLLDENLPHEFRTHLPGHDVFTVRFMGWGGIKNGQLLATAAGASFDVLITIDKGIPFEQNLQHLPIAVLLVRAKSNKLNDLLAIVPDVLVALNHLRPNAVTYVPQP